MEWSFKKQKYLLIKQVYLQEYITGVLHICKMMPRQEDLV